MEFIHALTDGVVAFAASPYAVIILFVLAFAESSFFPIPPDVLMIPLALADAGNALFFALLTTIGSVIGGVFGYYIGYLGGRPLLAKFAKGEKIEIIKEYYNKYDIWAVGLAALTPIPYKLFTISAGVFGLDIKRFIIASFIGRGLRFFAVGIMIWLFGPTIQWFLEEYLEIAILVFSLLLIGGFVLFGKISGRKLAAAKQNETAQDQKVI